MTAGIAFAGLSWIVVGAMQLVLDGGDAFSITWQVLPYVLLTFGEVLVAATGLEFAYSQAPLSMKGAIMAFWNLSVTIGNLWVLVANAGVQNAAVTKFIASTGFGVTAFQMFFFAVFAFAAALAFGLVARTYPFGRSLPAARRIASGEGAHSVCHGRFAVIIAVMRDCHSRLPDQMSADDWLHLPIVQDRLWCGFAQFNLCAHFLDFRNKGFNLLLLFDDSGLLLCVCFIACLLLLVLAVLFEKLIEQHRVDGVVADTLDLPVSITGGQIRIDLCNLLRYQAVVEGLA